jgi:hypothetical protein
VKRQVGDLVKEVEYPDIALIVEVGCNQSHAPYRLLCPNGDYTWFSREYVEERCEVVSESR